jgi:catechol 2,3-dioxygenase-like lactoylglutathione lyase family enzyme
MENEAVDVTAIDLDHVALAAERTADLLERFAGDLGGRWLGAGDSPGFVFTQVEFANGMRVECLEPAHVDQNDFLRRFLDRSGAGPHHITFKVPDIRATLDTLRGAGWEAMNVDLSDPAWQEAFLHPNAACGIVVQVAQTDSDVEDLPLPPPPDLPASAIVRPAALDRIVHVVADLDRATTLFGDQLGGVQIDRQTATDHRLLDVAWPGPGRLRLVEPTAEGPLASWLGDRAGRLHHLAFTLDDPAAVPGATPRTDGTFEVAPADNLGTRLILSAP